MGLSRSFETIRVAGLLHDVGKIGIPDRFLRKPGKLTDEEYEVVKQHVALGDMIVRDLPDIDTSGPASATTTSAGTATGYLDRLVGRRHPADRPDPRGLRRLLGDDDDPAVPQGPRRC